MCILINPNADREDVMKKILILATILSLFLSSTASAKIYSYAKFTDAYTTYTVIEPDYKEGDAQIIELCLIDGTTYVSVSDAIILPKQSEQVQETLKEVILSEELKDKIKNISIHYKLIEERAKNVLFKMKPEEGRYFMLSFDPVKMEAEKIKYEISATTLNLKDSLKPYLKDSVGYAQEIEQWKIDQKVKLGLG
jgi:hypothetical protein